LFYFIFRAEKSFILTGIELPSPASDPLERQRQLNVSQDRYVAHDDLRPAYRVAGDASIGKMKRLFILLDSDEAVRQPAKAANVKKKAKRQASGEGGSGSSGTKKKMASTQ
jgi:hypothetical protein